VVIPGDIALRHCNSQPLSLDFDYSPSGTLPSSETLEKAAKVLNDAETVTILGGAGCAGARAELIEVAGRLKAPIVHALRGKEFIEYDNPYNVGMTGLLGFASGYQAMMNCEALLVLGSDSPIPAVLSKRREDYSSRHARRADRPSNTSGCGRCGHRKRDPRRSLSLA